jgi:transposase
MGTLGSSRLITAILPHLTGLRVQAVTVAEDAILVAVTASRQTARCPLCHQRARRIHARFTRLLADLPWHGHTVRMCLHGRRFRCTNDACSRQTFRERLPQQAPVYSRRTPALCTALQAVGFALGGQPGARLAAALHLPASRMTLLRLLHAAPLPTEAGAPPTPRVLSVDDWAFRRGRIYGTILVDLERHRPVDLLPDRTAETVAAWLRRHPGVEIASRDRGGAYAEGIRQGAPAAVQVADRLHLLKNLGDALEAFLLRKHAVLRQAATEAKAHSRPPTPPTPSTPPTSTRPCAHPAELARAPALVPAPELPERALEEEAGRPHPHTPRTVAAQRERAARRARRLARYEAVQASAHAGMTQRQIARDVGLARGTIRRYLRAEAFPEQGPRPRPSTLRPYEPYLRQQWDAGVQDAAVLWRALKAQGYTGGASMVRSFLGRWRIRPLGLGAGSVKTGRRPHDAPSGAAPPHTCTCSPHRTRWLLVQPDLIRDTTEQQFLETLLHLCPQVGQARTLVQDFGALVHQRHDRRACAVAELDAWLVAAEHSGITELRGFARGVRRDLAAVQAALLLDWSQGQTEGQVNRLKTLKRQMYGRASFPLLRLRLLHSA